LFGQNEAQSKRDAISSQVAEFDRILKDSARVKEEILREQLTLWATFDRVAPPLLLAKMKTLLPDLMREVDAPAVWEQEKRQVEKKPSSGWFSGLFGW